MEYEKIHETLITRGTEVNELYEINLRDEIQQKEIAKADDWEPTGKILEKYNYPKYPIYRLNDKLEWEEL